MRQATPPFAQAPVDSGIRIDTLILIRWMAVAGQALTLLIVAFGLGFPFSYAGAGVTVAASALLNVALSFLYPRTARLVGAEALLHLGFDLVQLGVLLYLTGGLSNPFAVLLLVPVTVAATTLSLRATSVMAALALAILAALWAWSRPLPWAGPPPAMPPVYQLATFAAIGFTALFLAIYVLRVSLDARRWREALITTQAALEREAKMSELGALAAAAAHELGGPLGTIKLISKDLSAELSGDPDFGEDVALLGREAERCRQILKELGQRAEAEEAFPALALDALLLEIADLFADARVPVQISAKDQSGAARMPLVVRSAELRHGLLNLVDNAVRYARTAVTLGGGVDELGIFISVSDDGPGFPSELLRHLGGPFLGPSRSPRGGTGLGVFIATTLLERTGARLTFTNSDRGGAEVHISWPRGMIEAERVEEKEGIS